MFKVKIGYLDGCRFFRCLNIGMRSLEANEKYLNKINVFPVADADTGTNMLCTIKAVVISLGKGDVRSIAQSSTVAANAALDFATGNSGSIIAQFFYGFAKGCKNKHKINVEQFILALNIANKEIEKALLEVEPGTIVTVLKKWTKHLESCKTSDFYDLIRKSIKPLRLFLADTTKQLPVLKKHKVVDAGAQGFVYILELIADALFSEDRINSFKDFESKDHFKLLPVYDNNNFIERSESQFCAECIFQSNNVDIETIKEKLSELGHSIIVSGSAPKFRIHIHTNDTRKMFSLLEEYGSVHNIKIDDMFKQMEEKDKKEIGVITDSSCDLPMDYLKQNDIEVVPVYVYFGEERYKDKIELSLEDFKHKFNSCYPRTSQPSIEDFKRAIERVSEKYKKIIIITVSKNFSGTFQNACVAAKGFGNVEIIDSKSVSMGVGFVVRKAVDSIKKSFEYEEVVRKVKESVSSIKVYIAVPNLKSLINSGRLSGRKAGVLNLLNFKPILNIDNEGKLKFSGFSFRKKSMLLKICKLAVKNFKNKSNYYLGIAHFDAEDDAKLLKASIESKMGFKGVEVMQLSTAVSSHSGPGVVGIAAMEL